MFPIWPGPDRTNGVTHSWKYGFISLFLPDKCPFCRDLLKIRGQESPPICNICAEEIQWMIPPYCFRCGRPFPKGSTGQICSDCLKGNLSYDWGRSAALYKGVLAEAIQRFKYHGDINLSGPLSWFWNTVSFEDHTFDAIIPVPLHRSRLRERGFNQALLLSKRLSKNHGKKILPRVLQRIRNTLPQVELDHSQREKNVRGAFAVKNRQEIMDKNLLLVDDVLTTGATVDECAKVLKKSGARKVLVLTLARAGVE